MCRGSTIHDRVSRERRPSSGKTPGVVDVAPRGRMVRERCVRDPEKGRTVKRLEGEEIIEAHKEWMKTAEAKAANRLRGSVIERCFGDAKKHRDLRSLHGRGLNRAKAEIGLVVLVQTALTLARLRKNYVSPRENAA